MCDDCGTDPCSYDYALTLLPGGRNESLAAAAERMAAHPLPHYGGCPCLTCYAARLSTWRAADSPRASRNSPTKGTS